MIRKLSAHMKFPYQSFLQNSQDLSDHFWPQKWNFDASMAQTSIENEPALHAFKKMIFLPAPTSLATGPQSTNHVCHGLPLFTLRASPRLIEGSLRVHTGQIHGGACDTVMLRHGSSVLLPFPVFFAINLLPSLAGVDNFFHSIIPHSIFSVFSGSFSRSKRRMIQDAYNFQYRCERNGPAPYDPFLSVQFPQ